MDLAVAPTPSHGNVLPSMDPLAKPFVPECMARIQTPASRHRSPVPRGAQFEDHIFGCRQSFEHGEQGADRVYHRDLVDFVFASRIDIPYVVKVDPAPGEGYAGAKGAGIQLAEQTKEHPSCVTEAHSTLPVNGATITPDYTCSAKPSSSESKQDRHGAPSFPTTLHIPVTPNEAQYCLHRSPADIESVPFCGMGQSRPVQMPTGGPTEAPNLASPSASPACSPAAPGAVHDWRTCEYVTPVECTPYDEFLPPPYASRRRTLRMFFAWYIQTRDIHAEEHLDVLQYIYNLLVGWHVDLLGLAALGLWRWYVIGVHPAFGSELARGAEEYLGWVTDRRLAAEEFAGWWDRMDMLARFDTSGRGAPVE